MRRPPPRLIVTSGEPAGIGPELCLRAALRDWPVELVFAGDPALFATQAAALGLELLIETFDATRPATPHRAGRLLCRPVALAAPALPGRLDVANAGYVLALIDEALAGCRDGRYAAMVTAPVQKSVINDAGVPFPGHTEYLAAALGSPLPVMLLVAGTLRVALTTTHLPLAQVPAAITPELLGATLDVLDAGLRRPFGIARPRIVVLGLNPHAGEGGHLGLEERRVIEPALAAARARGIDARGPVPADTAFTPGVLESADAVLAMYHDQGLPVLKHVGFGQAVNVTLGLPIVRTSVDHGTALDLAGSGRADPGSLFAAIELAATLGGVVIRARKRFGQHFLHDAGVIRRIVAAIDPHPGERLVEIGPGLGALTRPLLEVAGRLEVVELDRDVIPELEARCAGAGELVIHQGDALEFDFRALAGDGPPLRLVGNLPYNISTPLLFHLLEAADRIRDMTFMLQKEVVDRIVAAPGGGDYGRLTVMLATRCRAERVLKVGPGAFTPPPKVDSAVVRIVPLGAPPFPLPDPARFARVVATAFSMRRKTLRRGLMGVVDERAYAATGIDSGRRPETLAAAEFGALAAWTG